MQARAPVAATIAAGLVGSVVLGGGIGLWSTRSPTTVEASSPSAPARGNYINRDGHLVPRPCGNWNTDAAPQNSSALCRDGNYSFSEHRQGSCSHHGGVARYR